MARSQKPAGRARDISGQKFGRLTVIERAPTPGEHENKGRAHWLCRCECGREAVVQGRHLRSGRTNSCGCLRIERFVQTVTKHGQARIGAHTRTYESWQSMRRRCLQEKESHYAQYGGRGITICARWDSFEAFLEDMGERPIGKTLDRFPDVDGNYEPGNCRWATTKEQNENKRNSLTFEFNRKRLSLKDWAKETGIAYATLRCRIRDYGWTIERAFSTPSLIERGRKCL